MTLQDQVRHAIKSSGLKQNWVAEKCGLYPQHLNAWIHGRMDSINERKLQKVLHLLELRTDSNRSLTS